MHLRGALPRHRRTVGSVDVGPQSAHDASGHNGAGLCLAIAASIVRAHDGALDLLARGGGGLVVTATFRATPATAA